MLPREHVDLLPRVSFLTGLGTEDGGSDEIVDVRHGSATVAKIRNQKSEIGNQKPETLLLVILSREDGEESRSTQPEILRRFAPQNDGDERKFWLLISDF